MWWWLACLNPPSSPANLRAGAFDYPFQGDANFGACGCEEYICDIRHLGADLAARIGTEVYPVSDGEVIYLSGGPGTGWGEGNIALFVRHDSDTGPFVALYGHIRSVHTVGELVKAGAPLGVVGPYELLTEEGWVRGVPHLHLGIHPGPDMPQGPTGQLIDLDCAQPTETAGFVAPIRFLRAHRSQ